MNIIFQRRVTTTVLKLSILIGILFQSARVKAARSDTNSTDDYTYQETYLCFYSLSCFIIEAVKRNNIKHVKIVNNVKVGSKLLTGFTH